MIVIYFFFGKRTVIYDACPRSFDSGIWFDRTLYGLTNSKDCPIGSLGQAFKTCDKEVGWLPADLFNCTSLPFVDLRETVSVHSMLSLLKFVSWRCGGASPCHSRSRCSLALTVKTVGSGRIESQSVHLGATGPAAFQSHQSQFEIVRVGHFHRTATPRQDPGTRYPS